MCAVSLWLGAASSTYGQAAAQATSTDVIWKNILVLRDKRLANSQQDEQNLNKLLDETQQQLQKLWEYTQQLVVENQRLKGGQGPSRAAAYTGGSLTSNPTTVYAPSIAGTGGGTVIVSPSAPSRQRQGAADPPIFSPQAPDTGAERPLKDWFN